LNNEVFENDLKNSSRFFFEGEILVDFVHSHFAGNLSVVILFLSLGAR